jgi:hypothetical protein
MIAEADTTLDRKLVYFRGFAVILLMEALALRIARATAELCGWFQR